MLRPRARPRHSVPVLSLSALLRSRARPRIPVPMLDRAAPFPCKAALLRCRARAARPRFHAHAVPRCSVTIEAPECSGRGPGRPGSPGSPRAVATMRQM